MNVAVAVPSRRVPRWHAWCIEALRREPSLRVNVFAAGGEDEPRGARVAGKSVVTVEVELDALPPSDADLIVDLTPRGVPAAAPHGVWRFVLGEHDDVALPFGREVARGDDTYVAELIRRHDGREDTLRRGRFAVTRWYPIGLRVALAEIARWPATFAAALDARATLPSVPREPVVRRPLGAGGKARFGASLGRRLAAACATAAFEVDEWNVGFVDGDAARVLSEEPFEVRWLPAPDPMTYIADPFVIERDGVRALLVETFDYADELGAIDALVLDDDDNVVRRTRALGNGSHLSYPYPVEIDGELYIMPENSAANEVALYRCVAFPDQWEREAVVFPAFDGVDTTLFRHDGRWWAFCTRYSRGSTLALHAFHADSPRGPWSAHALNPIVVDVACARPAGQPFVVDGKLYRPAQDCSDSYGGGLVIARIDELTPASYREEIVRRIDARQLGRWCDGIHTLSFARGRIVIDGKRVYHDFRKAPHVVKRLREAARRFRARRKAKDADVRLKTSANVR
ncbi:MAG TPA: hypothetical protein VHT53_07515 [Candidatus Elarobacter sp.]|nr:hypothetical protein [Candidatus Elarobacter sp.]